MMPDHLLPYTAVLEQPTTMTDSRGDETLTWDSPTRTTIRAWVDQQSTTETDDETRNVRSSNALLVTNHLNVNADDRLVVDGETWTVQGRPRKVPTLAGIHHLEATLRLVQG
jgi:hypothetical protein